MKGKDLTRSIHRLLALAFVYNPDPHIRKCVNHINGNKLDYRLENLEWVTPSENVKHAYEKGLMKLPSTATPVVNTCTGERFPSVTAAADALRMKPSTLRRLIDTHKDLTCYCYDQSAA
jgi:hypothetical protein